MPLIGGGLALSGLFGFLGSNKTANAQDNAANKQYQASQDAIAAAEKQKAYAVSLAGATPTELGLINQQISQQTIAYTQQMSAIKKDYESLNSAAPAIQEAGKQAFQLLSGQQAAILAPIQNQRIRDRQNLENTLKTQMGSGYATSSVGQKALLQFDLQTQDLMTNAQNTTLQNLANISLSGQGIGSRIASTQSQISNSFLAAPLTAVQNISSRAVNAATGNQVPYGQINAAGTAGFTNAAAAAGGGFNSLSNTFATGTSVLNSQNQTQQLLNSNANTIKNLFGPQNNAGSGGIGYDYTNALKNSGAFLAG